MEDILNLTIVGIMVLIAYFIARSLAKFNYFDFLFIKAGRYGAIDGLRGYLAIFIFVHHFILTWYWHNTGRWTRPREDYFQDFGEIGVMIFFMITGFLFISKIISDKGKTDWVRLYKSRVFRIYPLYLFVLIIVSIVVFYETNFHLNVEAYTLLKQYANWFVYYGGSINEHNHTNLIIAGVDWTLKYEWLFYLSLPLIAWIISKNKIITLSFLCIALALSYLRLDYYGINTLHIIYFIIGGAVAYLNSMKLNIAGIIQSKIFSIFTLITLLFSLFYAHEYSTIQVIGVSIFFASVALGNTMFGFFKSKASVFLGEISYSIYLLHGLIIYIPFSVMHIIDLNKLTLLQYEYTMPILIILIILLSTITHITVELPGIRYGKRRK